MRSVLALLALLALTSVASAESTDRGPEINPYECLGRYESATGNRSMTQVREELEKRTHPLFEGNEPHTVKAMKACVVAMLKSRLGDSDAAKYYAIAVAEDPEEPGYEYWYGRYYSGFRGARGVVVEAAETHFYRALEKLKAKKKAGKYRDYHSVVEEWTRKQLLVSYQEDGLHLGNQNSFSISAQFAVSKDTRDFFRNNEMRLFTGEMMFADSQLRGLGINRQQIYALVRTPLRMREELRLRLRIHALGAFDFSGANELCAGECQVTSYYLVPPTPNAQTGATGTFNDVKLREAGVGYERVIPLYPLMDFKLKGAVRYVDRQGVVEFMPERHEKFPFFEVRPSFSRFVGPDKATLDVVWVYMNVPNIKYGVPSEALRAKYIRAINLEYAIYRPFLLPEFRGGALGLHRTPTRGWYWNVGAADDDDVYGIKTVRHHDIYLGTRFEGSGNWDFTLQGTYSDSKLTAINPDTGAKSTDQITPLKSASFRTLAVIQRRIINPDAIPGINGKVIDLDMVNLVVPITWDKGLSGSPCYGPAGTTVFQGYTSTADCYKTYENFSAGAEIWAKFFGVGHVGPAVLTTIGYDYQYFYNIKKAINAVHLNVRMGWDWHRL